MRGSGTMFSSVKNDDPFISKKQEVHIKFRDARFPEQNDFSHIFLFYNSGEDKNDAIHFFSKLKSTDYSENYFTILPDNINPAIYTRYGLGQKFNVDENLHLFQRIRKYIRMGRPKSARRLAVYSIKRLIDSKKNSILGKSAEITFNKIINSRGPSRRNGPSATDLNRAKTNLGSRIVSWNEASKLLKKEEMKSDHLGRVIGGIKTRYRRNRNRNRNKTYKRKRY
jgi:hypothetical protein